MIFYEAVATFRQGISWNEIEIELWILIEEGKTLKYYRIQFYGLLLEEWKSHEKKSFGSQI